MKSAIIFYFIEMTEGCEVSQVKIIAWLINVQEGTTMLIFYILKYDAE